MLKVITIFIKWLNRRKKGKLVKGAYSELLKPGLRNNWFLPINKRRWSDYFQSYIYVWNYIDDNNWYFVIEGKPLKPIKAQTPFSQMKEHPDDRN